MFDILWYSDSWEWIPYLFYCLWLMSLQMLMSLWWIWLEVCLLVLWQNGWEVVYMSYFSFSYFLVYVLKFGILFFFYKDICFNECAIERIIDMVLWYCITSDFLSNPNKINITYWVLLLLLLVKYMSSCNRL